MKVDYIARMQIGLRVSELIVAMAKARISPDKTTQQALLLTGRLMRGKDIGDISVEDIEREVDFLLHEEEMEKAVEGK